MLSIPQIRHLVETRSYERLVDRVLTSGRSGNLSVRLRLASSEAQAPAALGLALQRVVELTYGPTPLAADIATRLIHLQVRDGLFGGEGPERSISEAPASAGGPNCGSLSERRCQNPLPRGEGGVGIPETHAEAPTPQARSHGEWGIETSLKSPCSGEPRWDQSALAFPGAAGAGGDGAMGEGASVAASAAALRGLVEYSRQRVESGAAPDPVIEGAIDRAFFALGQRQQWNGLIGEDAVEGAIVLWQLGGVPRFRESVRFADLCEAVDTVGEGVVTHELARLAHAMAA